MPEEKVIQYGEQISDGLAHAHEHGVIHRGLKTSNIMITPEGRAKVLDFGLARRHSIERVTEQTRSEDSYPDEGTGAGTMHYTTPEVFRGEPTDARSDIWALGVVLYEMTAGQRPFDGKTAYESSSHILNDQPKQLPATVTPVLRGVIEKCLTKLPTERYQHASEVRGALGAVGIQISYSAVPDDCGCGDGRPIARPQTTGHSGGSSRWASVADRRMEVCISQVETRGQRHRADSLPRRAAARESIAGSGGGILR